MTSGHNARCGDKKAAVPERYVFQIVHISQQAMLF